MSIPSVHHVNIVMPTSGESDARRFYGDLLGFPELPKPAAMAGRGGVWFAAGTIQLHLSVDPDFQPSRKAHVAYQVDDLDGLRHQVEELGYPTLDDVPLPGYRRFHTEDPFGNRVEFLEAEGVDPTSLPSSPSSATT